MDSDTRLGDLICGLHKELNVNNNESSFIAYTIPEMKPIMVFKQEYEILPLMYCGMFVFERKSFLSDDWRCPR